jgi:hypothetical protein
MSMDGSPVSPGAAEGQAPVIDGTTLALRMIAAAESAAAAANMAAQAVNRPSQDDGKQWW